MANNCAYAEELKNRFKQHSGIIGALCLECTSDCTFQRPADWAWNPEEVAMLKEFGDPGKEASDGRCPDCAGN